MFSHTFTISNRWIATPCNERAKQQEESNGSYLLHFTSMIHSLINTHAAPGLSYAEVGPAPFLTVLFIVVGFIYYAYKQSRLHENEEEDEERKVLRQKEIAEAMNIAESMLTERLDYFKNLSEDGRAKFLARLRIILATKIFIGKEGMKLTPEVEVMTAAAFVQVTFGLNAFQLPRFNKIVIYPDVFYNKLLDRNLKGSASPRGVLRFSWKHLEYGYKVADDNINLALHEVAHALKVSVDKEDKTDRHLDDELREFFESGEHIRDAILAGRLTLIRKYAGTNEHEFFACCVEYFFESPAHFKVHLPKLYDQICSVLQQDLTNVENDYEYRESIPMKGYVRKEKPIMAPHFWETLEQQIPTILIIGLFIGVGVCVWQIWGCESPATSILLFFGTVVTTGLMLFTRRFLWSGFMSFFSYTVFLTLGWTPLVAGAALVLNMLTPVYEYEVVDSYDYITYKKGVHRVISQDSELRTLRRGLEISASEYSFLAKDKKRARIHSTIYYGMFGLKVFGDVECRMDPQPAETY